MFNGNQLVETKWTTKNKDWYIQKGYEYTGINNILCVKAKDLTLGSKTKIKIICDCCGKEYMVGYGTYNRSVNKDLCGTCSHRKVAKEKNESECK